MSHTLRSLFNFDADQTVVGLSADSRQIKPGFIFAALPGTQMDGRDSVSYTHLTLPTICSV